MIRVKFLRERHFGGHRYQAGDEANLHNDIGVERLVALGDVSIMTDDIVLSPQSVTQKGSK